MSARRRRLQRSGRSLGGRHWSVAGSGRSRGSQRCGGVRGSGLAPGLAPAPVMQRAGLGIPGSEWDLGVGGVAAPPYVVREGFTRACSFGVGHAACRTGLPGSTRVCPELLWDPGASWESSCLLGASRPRGIPAGHTWLELRPGTGLTQPSGLWVASGSPTCLRACRVESGTAPAVARGRRWAGGRP